MRLFLLTATLLGVFVSCVPSSTERTQEAGDTIPLKYATLLTMVRYADRVEVSIANPWHKGQVLQHYSVREPFRRAAVFTAAHCQLLYDLHAAEALKAVCDLNYIYNKDIHRRADRQWMLDSGALVIADLGSGMAPDMEQIMAIQPDVMLISPFENSGGFGKLAKLGIPIIQTADYMENSALARAEWMKLYGILFGREREADSLFHVVDSTYQSLHRMAIKQPRGRSILTERKTGSVWYCPGGRSTVGQLLADANGSYAFADDEHGGSLPLSFEEVLAKAGQTEVWAFKFTGSTPLSKADLLAEFHGYAGLKAFQTGTIYECSTTETPFFEETPFRPDYLLREYIQLLHPQLRLGLRYFKKLK